MKYPEWLQNIIDSGIKLNTGAVAERVLQYVQSTKDKELYRRLFMKEFQQDTELGKALDSLKNKKVAIGTVHNGMKKISEGNWEEVKEGSGNKPGATENQSKHHAEEAQRHMKEATKHHELAANLHGKIQARKKVDPKFEVPEEAQNVLDESKSKAQAHTEDYHAKKKQSDDANSDVEATKQNDSVKESKKKKSDKNKNIKLEESAGIKKGRMQIAMQDHEKHEQYQADKQKEGIIADPRPKPEVEVEKGGVGSGKKSDGKNQHDLDARTYQLQAEKETDVKKKEALRAKALAAALRSGNISKGGPGSGKKPTDHQYRATELKTSYAKWRDRYLTKKDTQSENMMLLYESKIRELSETMRKSLIQADGQGSAIDTADSILELNEALKDDWYLQFSGLMEGYNYGDAPRTLELSNGFSIILSKVDDGLYSGFIRRSLDWDGTSALEETASKVEKQTLPSIIAFLKAKEYIDPSVAKLEERVEEAIEITQAEPASGKYEAMMDAAGDVLQAQEDIHQADMVEEQPKNIVLIEKLINLLDRLV